MWNHYAHFETYFGVIAAAGVLHTLNLRLSPEDIAYIANHARDRFLIVDDVLLPLLEQFRDKVEFERVIVVPLTGNPVTRRARPGGRRVLSIRTARRSCILWCRQCRTR